MQIKRLKLSDFRNYENEEIEFSEGQNIIFGENAQGKTNLLESIFYLSCLKPFRGSRDADAIMKEREYAEIKGTFIAYERDVEVKCILSRSGRQIFVNGVRERSPRNHIGLIKTVVFSPDDLQLIKEGPARRRRYMNIALSQMLPAYIEALAEHNKLIESKRKILKDEKSRHIYYDYVDVLNEKLAKCAAYITYERGEFIKAINAIASETMKKISGGKDVISVKYNCDSAISDHTDKNNARFILEHLKRRKEAEFASGFCLVGTHRDDFTVSVNGNSARDFGSQGQIRSCVLSLKVAEHAVIEKDSGEAPILLLDDVLSELDPSRRSFLLNDVNRGQTVITGCDPSMFSELSKGRIFTVEGGRIIDKRNNE